MPQTISSTRQIEAPDFGTEQTMGDLIRLAEGVGSHFFESSSMRFFRSRVYDGETWEKPDGWVFITSEQFQSSTGRTEPRKYTVRSLTIENGHLDIGCLPNHSAGFQAYSTLRAAKRVAATLTSAKETSQK